MGTGRALSSERYRRAQKADDHIPFFLSNYGGMNDDDNNFMLEDRDLRKAVNCHLDDASKLEWRPGIYIDPFNAALNSGGAILGIHEHIDTRGTVLNVIVISDQVVYKENDSADPST